MAYGAFTLRITHTPLPVKSSLPLERPAQHKAKQTTSQRKLTPAYSLVSMHYIYFFSPNTLNRYDNNFAAMALFISSHYLSPN